MRLFPGLGNTPSLNVFDALLKKEIFPGFSAADGKFPSEVFAFDLFAVVLHFKWDNQATPPFYKTTAWQGAFQLPPCHSIIERV
jgi:hypothetical protein